MEWPQKLPARVSRGNPRRASAEPIGEIDHLIRALERDIDIRVLRDRDDAAAGAGARATPASERRTAAGLCGQGQEGADLRRWVPGAGAGRVTSTPTGIDCPGS